MDADSLQLPIDLNELRSILKKHRVETASIFGSYDRGEARDDSDLDLFVKLKSGADAFDIVDLKYDLERATRHKVDVATKLHPRLEPYITPELIAIL